MHMHMHMHMCGPLHHARDTWRPSHNMYTCTCGGAVCTVLYYITDVALFVVGSLRLLPPWATAIARQLLELSTALLIGYAFRARPLSAIFEQVQQIAMDLAKDLLPEISTVTVDVAALRGDGTVPWSRDINLRDVPQQGAEVEQAPADMLVVLNPGDDAAMLVGDSAVERALVVAVRVDTAAGDKHRKASGAGSAVGSLGGGGRRIVPVAALNSLLGGATPWPAPTGTAAAAAGTSTQTRGPAGLEMASVSHSSNASSPSRGGAGLLPGGRDSPQVV